MSEHLPNRKVTYDERTGCIAVYYGPRRNSLSRIRKSTDCIYFAEKHWSEHKRCWHIHPLKRWAAKRAYRAAGGSKQ